MEAQSLLSNGNHNGGLLKKLVNGHCLPTNGIDFFRYLEEKSLRSYETLYHYIKTITQTIEDEQAVYVLDLADILWKIQLWKEKLPGVKPFYAVKANSDPVLIRLLVLLGFSYDCSTKGEIKLVLDNGGDPKDIIFAHTIKTPTSLRYASEVGVELMTFDSKEELFKIKEHYPSAKLVIRIKPENPPRSNETKSCPYNLGEKYGCFLQDAEKLLQQAVKLNLNVVGVSFHVGALCDDPSSYVRSIGNCRSVFDIAQRLGFRFEIIDIGAGFYGSAEREKYFNVVTTQIKDAFTEYFSEKNVKFIAEPGCYLVGSSQRHVTCIIGKRSTNNTEDTENGDMNKAFQREYFLNDGYYNNFFKHIELYDIYPRLLVTKEEEIEKRPLYKSKLWGQTCCSEDIIQEECLLPDSNVGEYVVWENMGAYTQGVCSTFTIVPPAVPKHVFILNSRLQLKWIDNLEKIIEFITENTELIKSDKFPE